MYEAPPRVRTRVFARLPQELRITDRVSAMSLYSGTVHDSFLEGPSFDRDGNLYCVDVGFGRILKVSPEGAFSVVTAYDGEPNGLKIHRDGRLFVADRRRGIVIIDPVTGTPDFVLERYDIEPFRGLNDLVFSQSGDLYFTDQGLSDLAHPYGRVFRLGATGRLDLLLEGLPSPNGIALDPGDHVLYVAVTRSNAVLRVPLLADGRPSRVLNFIQLTGGGGPDGLAVDQDGGIAIAHPMGAVWLFDKCGQPALRIDLCEGILGTNIAFGGPDGRRLYITGSDTGTIQVADLPSPGLAMFSHRGQT
ncbi:MAG: gluconolactonase [Bradyrhizobium sp.]|nr:gluconolactonase [Bradyrhizobium sp.]